MAKFNNSMHSTNIDISVIMSSHNDEGDITKSIDSILNQSFRNFELIIINDASTDKTQEIINKYLEQNNRIVLINNKTNIGLTKSLNIGIKHAKGKYIARQDADDISLPNRLETQYKFLEKNLNITLCATKCIYIDKDEKILGQDKEKINGSHQNVSKQLKYKNYLIHSSIMFRNTGLNYRHKFYFSQDYDFYLNLLSKNLKISIIDEYLVKWRVNSTAISYQNDAKQKLFGQKANELYLQRKKFGYDNYDKFDPNSILSIKDDNDHNKITEDKIILLIRSGNILEAKKVYYEEYKPLKNKKSVNKLLLPLFLNYPFLYKLYSKIRYG